MTKAALRIGKIQRRKLIDLLRATHNNHCHWCGIETVQTPRKSPKLGTVDHLKTQRQGRKDYMDGGHVWSCQKCNCERGRQEDIYYTPHRKLRGVFQSYWHFANRMDPIRKIEGLLKTFQDYKKDIKNLESKSKMKTNKKKYNLQKIFSVYKEELEWHNNQITN